MHSPVRVPFGLRSYATDSESGSWPGSDLSSVPSASDDDSLCGEFRCVSDVTALDGGSVDSGITPKDTKTPPQRGPKAEVAPQRSKESWSEIDERARRQEKERPRAKVTAEPPPRNQTRHNRNTHHYRNRNDPRTPSNSDKSENWRSKPSPKRRQDRRRSDKRRPRMDPPLKGAVVRPYTLPSGPITVLRRPTSDAQGTTDAANAKLPGTSELEHLGFVEDPALQPPPFQEAKENDQCVGAPSSSNAKLVTTRFGEGFLVENPSNTKSDLSPDTPPGKGTEMKVARNAAMMAMAGLSMGSRDAKETESRSWDTSVNAETYDRSLGGYYKRTQPKRPAKRSKDSPPIKTGLYSDRRGPRSRPNVVIGRRPKLETRHVREDDFLLGE